MAFLTDEDYLAQIDQADLLALSRGDSPELDEVVVQASPTTPAPSVRARAEANALAEVASYLRGRYDMAAAYALEGDARNQQLVMICVDVTIWHLVPRVAFLKVSEVRELRYNAAIKWLTMAQKGQTNPDLPLYPTDANDPQRHSIFSWGSNPRRSQDF
jgi:phage gp36-like protein